MNKMLETNVDSEKQREILSDPLVSKALSVDGNPVIIWAFPHAPECLKKLSRHGGDENFVVMVRNGLILDTFHENHHFEFLFDDEDDPRFGFVEGNRFVFDNGLVVTIWAHA